MDSTDELAADGSQSFLVESWNKPFDSSIKSLWRWFEPELIPLRISISGVAGTGKNELADGIANHLDLTKIGSISSTVKALGGKLDKESSMNEQFMMFMAQAWEQQEYGTFVSAGSLIDIIAHMHWLSINKTASKLDSYIVRSAANMTNYIANNNYTVLLYLPYRGKTTTQKGRYLHELDFLTKYYLDAFDLDYLPIDGTPSEKLATSIRYMRNFNLLGGVDQ